MRGSLYVVGPCNSASVDVANEGRRGSDYGAARIGGALALIAGVVFMVVVDALSAEYLVDVVVVTSLLGAAAALLGVEIIGILSRRDGR